MSDKPETSADITAEIRARAGAWPEPALTKYDMTLADRIDAAVKRECIEAATRAATQGVKLTNEKHANMPIGNTAAMHDALEIAKKAICNRARANHTCASLAWENSTINANCGDILCSHRDLCEAKTAIQKALAKPPRNCDMYGGDHKMLHTAWFDWTGSPSGQNADGTVKLTFSEWLLEKAVRNDN